MKNSEENSKVPGKSGNTVTNDPEKAKNLIQRKFDYFSSVFKTLLRQGLSPKQIAAALALGFAAGTFPVVGTHTFLAIGFAFILRLNQLAVYLGTWISIPAYILLLLPSLRVGEYIWSADPANMDLFVKNLKRMFNSCRDFFDVWMIYGKSILHAITGWAPLVIVVCLIVYILTYYVAKLVVKKRSIKDIES
jgi:uncharacterized protein (DUF2062 family)